LAAGAFQTSSGFCVPIQTIWKISREDTECQLLVIAKWYPVEIDADPERPDYQLAALWVHWDGGVAYRRGHATIMGPGDGYRIIYGTTLFDVEKDCHLRPSL
jgi:hypothetical protein